MKLSKNIRERIEAAKNAKIGASGLEIEVKEKDCTKVDANTAIPLLRVFHLYTQILVFWLSPAPMYSFSQP